MTITFGELLDLHDPHRDSNEYIHIMDEDNEPVMTGPVRSPYWEPFEDRLVTAIEAAASRHMNVWLKEERRRRDEQAAISGNRLGQGGDGGLGRL